MKSRNTIIISVLTATLSTTLTIFTIQNYSASKFEQSLISEAAPIVKVNNDQSVLHEVNFVNAANNSIHSVVHIETMSVVRQNNRGMSLQEYLYGKPRNKQSNKKLTGSGSGVIISADGYIATNYHVIKGAQNIRVTLNNKKSYEAKIIGKDPNTDLELLKIEEEDLANIKYGNSDDVQIGEWVLAVGNPFNLTSTVTAGIVSAKGREINMLREQYAVESFIQTDAAVNPGNSGGALVNTNGELVGINTAIASNTGSYTGYSFAVPVNIVKKVMNDLRTHGKVQRALLGIQISDINSELALKIKTDDLEGVYVNKVFENSPAKSANIQTGDVIKSINGKKTKSIALLKEYLGQVDPNHTVHISYEREGKLLKSEIKLTRSNDIRSSVLSEKLGASYRSSTDSENKKLGISGGIKITELKKGKLQEIGLPENFVITHIDNVEVKSEKRFNEIISRKKGGLLLQGKNTDGSTKYFGLAL